MELQLETTLEKKIGISVLCRRRSSKSVEMLLSPENLAEHQYGEHKGKYLTKRAGLLINQSVKQEAINE